MHVIILGLCDCEGSKSKNLSKTQSYTSIQARGCEECFYKPWNLRYFCCCWWLTNLTDSLHETTKDSAIGLVTCDLLPVICLRKASFLADTTCTWTIFPNRLSQSKNTATVCRTIHAWNTFVFFGLIQTEWFETKSYTGNTSRHWKEPAFVDSFFQTLCALSTEGHAGHV